MKCPECRNNQKYKDGMTCRSCGYRFALNPKAPYGLTDAAFKGAVERLSGFGQYYFTRDQLYAQICRLFMKKRNVGKIAGCFLFIFVTAFFTGIGSAILSALSLPPWAAGGVAVVVALLLVWLLRRPFKMPAEAPLKLIQTYHALHPIERLVTGKTFAEPDAPAFEEEFIHHAPERVLVVQHDDTADMLIANRFHFENKTLVVSARKYPAPAFRAFQKFMAAHPDLPVHLIHDCSADGLRMQGRLANDPEWGLEGKRVFNLGIHPTDVERLKQPVWIPDRIEGIYKKKNIRTKGKAMENIEKGLRFPLGAAPPRAVLGALTMAVATGAALLSTELLAQMNLSEQGRTSVGGGFG